jgi:hypothetical protein
LLRRAGGIGAFWGAAESRSQPPTDVAADVDPGGLISKLARRITMGPTPTDLAQASSLGYGGYLEYHLNPGAIDDSALDARLATLTTLTMQPYQLYALTASQVINELTEAVILRSVLSKRQLFERVVEFWTDHFNIDITKEADTYLKTVDDRDVIRANALGTFPALLWASAHSPAMLQYLDNSSSVKGNPNENYAREIMELHTLGVDGGYTQQDVKEVARCFTGWGMFGRSTTDVRAGTFRFDLSKHDQNQKVVLGHTIPINGGMQDGLTVLNILSAHPSTARYIAGKLCRWFLGDSVPQGVIDSVAATYTTTGGDIKAMIRQALSPNVLFGAFPRYKRPYHLMVSAMRMLPTTITATSGLRSQLQGAGQRPFYWTTPDGYPDYTEFWVGLILPRWNFGASLLNGNVSGVAVDQAAFFAGLSTAQQMADQIDTAMFGGEMPAPEKNRIRTFLLPDAPTAARKRDAIALAIGAPSFQWY